MTEHLLYDRNGFEKVISNPFNFCVLNKLYHKMML